MRRRDFIAGSGAAVTWPMVGRAQQQGTPVIGFLNIASPEAWTDYVATFRQGIGQAGFFESRNVAIEYRWARGDYNRLPELANELVARRVSVIAANGGARSALAAKAATSSIPIIFTFGDGDPVKYGLVDSISHPGHNITGVTMIGGALEPKRLQLLREIAPKLDAVYILVNPNNAGVLLDIPAAASVAGKLGLGFETVQASTEDEIDLAFKRLARDRAQALMVANDGFFTVRSSQIAGLAERHNIPTIYPWREYVVAGGLISYGTSIRDAYRQSGLYVGQVLKGTQPSELPVQQPTKFELVINLKAARALGLEVPTSLLLRADEVIE